MFSKAGECNPLSLEAQLDNYAMLAHAAMQRTADLVELQIAFGKDSLKGSADGRQRLLAAADANQYFTCASLLTREQFQRSVAYAQDLIGIVTKPYIQQEEAVAGARAVSKVA